MLGQLEMTVRECKDVYEELAGRVFGNPRKFSMLGFARNKYSGQTLDQAVLDVLAKRGLPLNLGLEANPPIFYRQAINVSLKNSIIAQYMV
jgi:hypothetical protein